MKKIFIFSIVLLNFNSFFTQSENLGQFDDKFIHFGFAVSTNKSGFDLERTFPGDNSLSSIFVLDSNATSFSLGVVTSININPNFKIRFIIPTLSFLQRKLEYTFFDSVSNTKTVFVKDLDQTYLEFPLLLKFRTNRIKNFAAYGITGFKCGIDMTSNIDVNNGVGLEDQIIKLDKTDFTTEVGGGVDLFLKYFKLGIEIKLASGIRNLLYLTPEKAHSLGDSPTIFENSIKSLRSRVWTLSFTFEG